MAATGPSLEETSDVTSDVSHRVRLAAATGSSGEGSGSSRRRLFVDDDDYEYPPDISASVEADLDTSDMHHGDMGLRLMDDPDIANLSSKIRRIFVSESPRDETGSTNQFVHGEQT